MSHSSTSPTERFRRATPSYETVRPTAHASPPGNAPDPKLSGENIKREILTDTDQQPRRKYDLRSSKVTPQSPRPNEASNESPLEALAVPVPQLNCEATKTQVKLESSTNEPGCLFGDLPKLIPQYSQDSLRTRYKDSSVRRDKVATLGQPERPLRQRDSEFSQGWTTAQASDSSTDGSGAKLATAKKSEHPSPKLIKEERDNIKHHLSYSSSSRSDPGHGAERVETVTEGEVCLTAETRRLSKGGESISVQKSKISINESAKTKVSSKTLSQILPFNTRERIIELPGICVASLATKPGQRCSRRAKGPIGETTKLLEGLSKLDIFTDNPEISNQLIKLISSALCTQHKDIALKKLREVQNPLGKLPQGENHSSLRDTLNVDPTILAAWISALTCAVPSKDSVLGETGQQETRSKTKTRLQGKNQTPEALSSTVTTETSELSYVTPASATSVRTLRSSITTTSPLRRTQLVDYVQNFQPYRPKSTAHLSTSERIRQALIRPLIPREMSTGNIYIYWSPPNFGRVKIGVTCGDPQKRLERWQSKCKHNAKSLLDMDMQEQFKVQHVFRVEALVHAELHDVRLKEINCRGCGGNHREWFCGTIEHCKKVMMKFLEFMKKNPYELVHTAGKSEWRLKESITDAEIDELCRPLELEQSSKNNINVKEPRRAHLVDVDVTERNSH